MMDSSRKDFFAACLKLQVHIVRKRLLALLAMGLAALLLSAIVVAGVHQVFSGRGFGGIRIAVASEEENEQLDVLIDLLAGMQDVKKFAVVSKAGVSEVEELVRSGQVNAAIVLPQGFVQSLMSGENLPPKLVLDASRPLEMMLVVQLAENASRMLVKAQQSVGYTAEVYARQGVQAPPLGTVVMDVNMAFAFWVLQRGGMFQSVTVNPTGALGLSQHYLLSTVLFFAILCLPVLYRLYSFQEQKDWLARLRSAGCSLGTWMASQVLVGAAALFLQLTLLVLATGVFTGGKFSIAVLPALALAALFLSCFGFVLANVGGPLSSVGSTFLSALVFWVVAGGVLPPALLPAGIARLAPFSPITWMRAALAPVFGAPVAPWALVVLLAGTALLWCLGFFMTCKRPSFPKRRAVA